MCDQGHELLQNPDDTQIKENHFQIIMSRVNPTIASMFITRLDLQE
jgi:hypothetical protein